MSALDTTIAAVQASTKLDAGKKELVTAFLQAAGPAIVELGEDGLNAVLGVAAEGGDVSAAVVANLDARGVASLLAQTEAEMAALADAHAAQAQAARAAVQTLEAAALTALAQAIVGL